MNPSIDYHAFAPEIVLVATIVVYAVFERYLLVLLPRGRWTNF